jgi:hypothetical protein
MTPTERFWALFSDLQVLLPGLEIKYKRQDEPWWLSAGFRLVSLFNKRFYKSYTTVIGRTIYFPYEGFIEANPKGAARTLLHEATHIWDSRVVHSKWDSFWWSFRYLFPQSLAPLGLLGFLGFAWEPLFALFAVLLAALPWPAPWRVGAEKRGYAMTIAALKWDNWIIPREHLKKQFTSSSYYFMAWSDRGLDEWYNRALANADNPAGAEPYTIFQILWRMYFE